MKKRWIGSGMGFAAILALVAACSPNASAGTLFCPMASIDGWDGEHAAAAGFVGKDTDSAAGLKFFLAAKGEELYLESNYKPSGQDYHFKVSTDEAVSSVAPLVEATVTGFRKLPAPEGLAQAIETQAEYYVSESVFRSSKYAGLDYGDSENVFVVGHDGQARRTRLLETDDPAGQRIVELGNSVFGRIGDTEVVSRFTEATSRPFDGRDLRVISLVDDTATDQLIKANLAENEVTLSSPTSAAIDEALAGNRGKTVLVVGHVEDGSFVMDTPSGDAVLTVSIDRLMARSRALGVTVVPVGCSSAKYNGRGVASDFYSAEAIERIAKARDARTMGEFLERFAGEDLPLVVDSDLLAAQKEQIALRLHRKSVYGNSAVAAGAVGVVFLVIGSQFDDDGEAIQVNGVPVTGPQRPSGDSSPNLMQIMGGIAGLFALGFVWKWLTS